MLLGALGRNVSQRLDDRIDPIASEQMPRHPVGDAERSRQKRPLAILDQDEVVVDERRAGRKAAPRVGASRRQTTELDTEPDAGSTTGDIVLQVAVEALEAGIDIGRHGDEQQLHVDRLQAKARGQAPQSELRTLAFRRISSRLDFCQASLGLSIGCHRLPSGEQPVDVRRGDVEPAKPVVGLRIREASTGDCGFDPRLDQLEPAEHMAQRGVGHLRAVDAANAEDAAGLPLFAGPDQLVLRRDNARFVERLTRLQPSFFQP